MILGHHYQRDEVVKFADFRGDSLKLSYQAAEADRPLHRFLWRAFHGGKRGHSAPRASSGHFAGPECWLLDGGYGRYWPGGSLLERAFFRRRSESDPITYMNSTAAIKSFTGEHGGAVCTSSNAAVVMKWAYERGEKVLFLPDEHLGRNTAFRMGIPLDRMIVWDPYEEFGGNSADTDSRRARNSVERLLLRPPAFHTATRRTRAPRASGHRRNRSSGVPLRGYPSRRSNRLDRRHHQGDHRIAGGLAMGGRHRNSPGQSAQQGTTKSQSDVARSQRVRLHDDVSHHPAASSVGAGQPGRRQRRQPHFGR